MKFRYRRKSFYAKMLDRLRKILKKNLHNRCGVRFSRVERNEEASIWITYPGHLFYKCSDEIVYEAMEKSGLTKYFSISSTGFDVCGDNIRDISFYEKEIR